MWAVEKGKLELTGLADGRGVEGVLTCLRFSWSVSPSPTSAKDLKQLSRIKSIKQKFLKNHAPLEVKEEGNVEHK